MLRFLRVSMLWVVLLPYLFIGVGIASNWSVLIANHGKFPVMFNEYQTSLIRVPMLDGIYDLKGHCLMTHDTHLNALADVFPFSGMVYSIGDFLLMLGEWLNGFCFYVWMALVVKSLFQKATICQ